MTAYSPDVYDLCFFTMNYEPSTMNSYTMNYEPKSLILSPHQFTRNMPSFDIVSKIDGQTLDNAVNTAKKEILNRYDFHDSKSTVELDKKTNVITVVTENDMRLKAITDSIISRMVKQHLDPKALDLDGTVQTVSGNMIKKDVKIKEGIEQEAAKKIVKKIKDSGLKVQASIMDDQVRVQAKKIDDLQEVIALCRQNDFGQPLQYINMRN